MRIPNVVITITALLSAWTVWYAAVVTAEPFEYTTLKVTGVACSYCLNRIDAKLSEFDGYDGLGADWGRKLVVVRHGTSLNPETIVAAVAELGYPAEAVAVQDFDPKDNRLFQKNKSTFACCYGSSEVAVGCPASGDTWKRFLKSGIQKILGKDEKF